MVRTVISLDDNDKQWLDREAARQGVPMTRLIRRAVRLLRQQGRTAGASTDELLDRTRGLWKRGDGLRYQNRLRDEW